MRKFAILLAAVAIWGATFGAEFPSLRHVGIWAYEDDSVYIGVSLSEDGVCKVVLVDKHDVGLGFNCRYVETRGDILTTAAWDSSGHSEDASAHLAYDASADVVQFLNDSGVTAYRLARVPKLAVETERYSK